MSDTTSERASLAIPAEHAAKIDAANRHLVQTKCAVADAARALGLGAADIDPAARTLNDEITEAAKGMGIDLTVGSWHVDLEAMTITKGGAP